MNKIGLFYAFHTEETAHVAERIAQVVGMDNLDVINAEELTEEQFLRYDNCIVGVATWWDGELPNYWDEFVPAIEDMNLEGKKMAVFGLGDQDCYGENFNDGVGIMVDLLKERGATIVGYTSASDYDFEHSEALKEGNQFCGLCLDEVNQPEKSETRIQNWVSQLKKDFLL